MAGPMASGILIAVVMLPVMARGASLHGQEQGSTLQVDIPCAKQVEIVADPALSGQVVLDAQAEHDEEIAQIAFAGGSTIRVKARGECWRGADPEHYQPTLDIRLRVPAAFPLGIDAAGSTDYQVTSGGPLAFDLSGSGHLNATRVTTLGMDLSGSGSVNVLNVAGPITIDLSGLAKVLIGHAESATASVKISGSGRLQVKSGAIGRISLDGAGSGDVSLDASVGDAAIDLSGSGSVSIGRLTGKLVQDVSGSGKVSVRSGQ